MKSNANPTKEFFISMITRDIDLKAAILELIDNSIDGAKRIRPKNNYNGLYIKIIFNKYKFQIEDNCGGISIKNAKDTAFRFGKSNKSNDKNEYNGVFGIGMKRAIFKIGKKFYVSSKTLDERFKMDVDLEEWMKDSDPNWTFNFCEIEKNMKNNQEDCGTKIIIEKINDGILKHMELESFEKNLISCVERYGIMLSESGLKIFINNNKVTFLKYKLIESDNLQPYFKHINIRKVNIKVLAGIVPRGTSEKAGWYIFCNGRMIVYADKTILTGWGQQGVKKYHPSMACFRGYVFFQSTFLNELPWNTTKTSVDTSSVYYITAKSMMKEAFVQIIKLITLISNFSKEEKIEVKKIFFAQSKIMNIVDLELKKDDINNDFIYKLPKFKDPQKMTTINFKKSIHKVNQLKQIMGASTNKEVGERIFDYYYSKRFRK